MTKREQPSSYGDLSKEEIEAIISAPDFDEQMKKAQENMDAYMRRLREKAEEGTPLL